MFLLQANIRVISAKFFAEGLTAHTGIVTGTVPLANDATDQETFDDEEDIYDMPPGMVLPVLLSPHYLPVSSQRS